MGECESHSQLMSKFVILNKGVIDKVSNCRRQEGIEGGCDGRTDILIELEIQPLQIPVVTYSIRNPNVPCIFTIVNCTRSPFLPQHILYIFFLNISTIHMPSLSLEKTCYLSLLPDL